MKQLSLAVLDAVPPTAALPMDRYLDTDTRPICTLPSTVHQTPTLSRILDSPTVRHLARVMDPPSQDHSWRVVTTSALTRSKSSMKLPE